MTIRVVRLGTPRSSAEGLRIGTVRRPPRGVPKSAYGAQNWYDVWLPNLAPSVALIQRGKSAASERDWAVFARKYRGEMAAAERCRLLDLLAALSHSANFSVGCYCADESRCHRSVLRKLLQERGGCVNAAPNQTFTGEAAHEKLQRFQQDLARAGSPNRKESK